MGLRDFLKKKDDLAKGDTGADALKRLDAPEFTIIRSDTTTQEIIYPPSGPTNEKLLSAKEPRKSRHSLDVFRSSRSRSPSNASQTSQNSKKDPKRLSQRLHLSRAPDSSDHVPENLPEIIQPHDAQDKDAEESQWENRATILASQNDRARSRPTTPVPTDGVANLSLGKAPGSPGGQNKSVSSKAIDDDIQEAIRLHEEGDLDKSTKLFGKLADPCGANNPLSQVLYGLALRHGWGCEPDPAAAVRYLTAAASNAASIEQMALQAGLKKGGAAKGELVLAIFELANCFRHGWGIEKDAYAAKQYYETAANLGDTDAMNEVAWCYMEGYGCKKDKFASARYYRLAEKSGNKTLGNSWIWKEKYNPPGTGSGKK